MWSSAWRTATQRQPSGSPSGARLTAWTRRRATVFHSASVRVRSPGSVRTEQCQTCFDELFPFLERELSTTAACRLTGRSRATHYRRLNPPAPKDRAPPRPGLGTVTCRTRAGAGPAEPARVRRSAARAGLGP